MNFKRLQRTIIQGVPWKPGQSLQQIPIPTDLAISKLVVRLSGRANITTGSPGVIQGTPWPAAANLLGLLTLNGSSADGTDGIKVENIGAGALWLRSWMMHATQPKFVDVNPADPSQEISISIPINFMDERLDRKNAFMTALEAMRFGGGNSNSALTLQIKTGRLFAADGFDPDNAAIIGGDYSGFDPGTLEISVVAECLQPVGWNWPHFDKGMPMPMFDLDLEYITNPAISQPNTNNFPLQRKGFQAETFFMSCDRDGDGVETPKNNLGATGGKRLVEKIGGSIQQDPDPNQLQDDNLAKYLPAATAWPVGLYISNDWDNNLRSARHFLKNVAAHTWDLNKGPSTAQDSLLRVLHVTYNPSMAVRRKMGL